MTATRDRMDATILRQLLPYLGLNFGGDVGGYTIYRTKTGKLVAYPRTFPSKPPSDLQRKQRLRFACAQQNWMGTPPSIQALWELLTKRLSLCLTGQNLWIRMSLTPDPDRFASALAATGIQLSLPPFIP